MPEEGKSPEVFVISTSPELEGQGALASYGADAEAAAAAAIKASPQLPAGSSKGPTAASASGRKKRGRKAVQNQRPPSAGPDSEDISIHVEAGWSEDEGDSKEPPAKRTATSTEHGSAGATKKAAGPLSNFTVRAVVTRKDVEVIFGHDRDKPDQLEAQTGTKITIISGKDDPDIVVDRVLSVKGPIDGVAAAYKIIADGMLVVKSATAAAVAVAAPISSLPAAPAVEVGEETKDTEPNDGACENANSSKEANPAVDLERTSVGTGQLAQDEGPGIAESKSSAPASGSAQPAISSITLRLLVPHKCVGSIMGHGGRTINNIRDVASVNIHTSETTLPLSSERIVELVGMPGSIQKAIGLVAEALTKDMPSYTSADYYVPAANLPSAMTVETHIRKRKDQRRAGNGDQSNGNRGQAGGRVGGSRGNAGNSNGGVHGQGRSQGSFGHSAANRNHGGAGYGGAINRHDRSSRQGDRLSGRSRGPGATTHVNRMPVGSNRPHGQMNQYNNGGGGFSNNVNASSNNNGGYRMANQLTSPGSAAQHSLNYGGYAVPAPTAYPTYVAPNAGVGAHMGRGGPSEMRYGGAVPSMGPTGGAYGNSFDAAGPSYQYPAQTSYGYGVAPVQNMYNTSAEPPVNTSYSRQYPVRDSRPQMPQPAMPMGTSGGAPMGGGPPAGSAGQTIQQIYVPGDKIGAVIGRRGETINEIRRTTNARVDIQDSGQGAKQRLIVITGGYEHVRTAYYMIKNKVDMARPSSKL
ncbi:RNA binding protein, heterogenous nuclear RNP-K like protein [Coemansia sp. RSA 2322]|nr:RNA binding protein, heterogenous nuclear RNP-K like protein [Coemansia sp. RSA 2322]